MKYNILTDKNTTQQLVRTVSSVLSDLRSRIEGAFFSYQCATNVLPMCYRGYDEVIRTTYESHNNHIITTYYSKLSLRKIAAVAMLLLSFGIGQAWGDASTTSDDKTASGTITFDEVGTLSPQNTYWYNGIKFYEQSTNEMSTDKGKRWTSKIKPPIYGTFTSGANWSAGTYDMTGLIMQAHCLAINVGSPCTIEIVVNMSGKALGESNPVVPGNLKVFWDGTAYNTAYTSSNYKTGTAKTDTTWEQNINSKYNRMKLSIPVTQTDLDSKTIDVIKVSYTGSATGTPGYSCAFVYESVKIIPASTTTYTVTYDANGGSGAAMANSTGASIDLSANTYTAPSGYSFAGWNTAADGTGTNYTDQQTGITANLNLYAQWTQTVTLDANTANHGSVSGSATATYNGTALSSIIHATGESGYSLTGYYTAATDGTKVLNANGAFAATTVTDYITDGKWIKSGATTLYAQWIYERDKCVTFNDDFASAVSSGTTYDDVTYTYSVNTISTSNGAFLSSAAHYVHLDVAYVGYINRVVVTIKDIGTANNADKGIKYGFVASDGTTTNTYNNFDDGAELELVPSTTGETGIKIMRNGTDIKISQICIYFTPTKPDAPLHNFSNGTFADWGSCAGGDLTLTGSESGLTYRLFRDGVAVSGSDKTGNGSDLIWHVDADGTYTVHSLTSSTYMETTMNGAAAVTLQDPTLSGPTRVKVGSDITLLYPGYHITADNWTSDNTAVATVLNGVVHGVSAGTATITLHGVSGCDGTQTVTVVGEPEGWVIFEGEYYDAIQPSPVAYTPASGIATHPGTITFSTVGNWSNYDVSTRTNSINDKQYAYAWKASGTASTTNNYLSFTIPTGYTATFNYVFATGSNSAVYKLGTTANGDEVATLTTFPASGATKVLQGGSYNTPLAAGTYYLGNSNTIHIVELIFTLTEISCTAPTIVYSTFEGKDYAIGATADLTFSFTSVTPNNGGDASSIHYQWYQNTTGSKVGAEIADLDTDGCNTCSTYKPRTDIAHTHYYYCVVTEDGCSKTAETDLSGRVQVTDPCSSWGYGTSNTNKFSDSKIVSGDLTITAIGGLGTTTTTPFDDSGSLAYVIGGGFSGSKYITGSLGGSKIEQVSISASTSAAAGDGMNKEAMCIAFSSKSTFDPNYLVDYSSGVQIHVFKVAPAAAAKADYTFTAPAKAKSFAISRNFSFAGTADEEVSSWSNNRFIYRIRVCPSDDCTPEFDSQPESQTVDAGASVTLSITSEDATNYQWFSNTENNNTTGTAISGEISSTYTFTAPSTAGTYYYYCNIMKGTCPSNSSDVAVITVLKGCDDETIIDASLTGPKAATVTGTIGGTADVSLGESGSGGYKLGDDGQYFMVTLADGNFQEGDVIKFTTVKASGSNKLYFYSSKTAEGKFAEIDADAAGTYSYTLTASDISDYSITNTIGSFRESSDNNPFFSSISVERFVCHGCTPPTITTQPVGTTTAICSDSKHTLSVAATGGMTPYTYKWYKDGVEQTSHTTESFEISTAAEAGDWYCEVYGADDCYSRSNIVTVEVNTKVTVAWETEPADGKVDAPWTHPSVTTNYADGVVLTSDKPEIVTVEWNTTDEVWDLKYIAEGDATITATVTGAGDYCGTAVVTKLVNVAAPDCDAYSFNWGTEGVDDWSVICFTQVGTTTTWMSSLFTIPTATGSDWDEISTNQSKEKYYVGWKGSWNTDDANSADGYFFNSMPYALIESDKTSPVYPADYQLIGAAREGNVGGAQGYLRIFGDRGDKNKFVGFIPAGYAVRLSYQTNADPEQWDNHEFIPLLAASDDKTEKHWLSDVVTITEDMLKSTTRFDVDLKTTDSYVWAEGKSYWETPLGHIGVKSTNDSWRGTAFAAGDVGMKGKFAIWADSRDVNWAIYFIPYIGITFDLNSSDATWTGTAPDLVSIEGDDASRTVTIPAELPTREGYLFIGWNTSSTATTSSNNPGTAVTLTDNLKLYAVWEKVVTVTGPAEVEENMTITLTPSETGGTWASTDPTVASVVDGVVTGLKVGETTTITYTKGTQTISHTVTVTCQYVDIISYSAIATGTAELTDQEATGSIGGTGSQKLSGSSNTKLNGAGNYVFVTLARGNFQSGDRIKITISKEPDTEDPKRLSVFSSNADGGWYKDISDVTEAGTYMLELGSDLPTTNTIGLRRTSTYKQNAYITSITVARPNCSKLVKPEVSITGHETAICSGDGTDITLTANVTAGTADSYQWYADDVAIDGETSVTYTFTPTPLDASVVYKVVAVNALFTSDKSAGVNITFKPGVISGPTSVMRTQDIELTANAVGGTWSVNNDNATLSAKVDADGKSTVTLTGVHEGSVVVSYLLDGCENKYNVEVTEYIVCNTFDHTAYNDYDWGGGAHMYRATDKGAIGTGSTTYFADNKDDCNSNNVIAFTDKRILLYFPQSVTKIIMYGQSGSDRTISDVKISTEAIKDTYSDFTTCTKNSVRNDKCLTFTIECTSDTYFPANNYIWINLSGTPNIHTICYKPVDCSYLDVTAGGTTTLDNGQTVTLTATQTGGTWTSEDESIATVSDNGSGVAVVTAQSINLDPAILTYTTNITYTMPNGCEIVTPVTVNKDPCPKPDITIYTAKKQTLGTGQDIILSGTATAVEGTLSYEWYSNETATTTGATLISTEKDFITPAALTNTTTYYFLRVTNTNAGDSKFADSEFVMITTSVDCTDHTLISANIHTGTSNIEDVFEADGGIVGGSLLQKTEKTGKIGSNGHYVFLQLAEGNFQAGDVFTVTSSATPAKLYLYFDTADDKYISTAPITSSATANITTEYTLTQDDIAAGITNKLGLWRQDSPSQNPTVTNISVYRPFCHKDKTTCLDDIVNFNACQVDAASGFTYQWKANGTVVGNTYQYTATATTVDQNIVCTVTKGTKTSTSSFNITGDNTDFHFALNRTAYYKGMTDELIPDDADDSKYEWTFYCSICKGIQTAPDWCYHATIKTIGGKYIFTPNVSNDNEITIYHTNKTTNCYHTKTITCTNPYFVFKADIDNNWGTADNWYYATSSLTYKLLGKTGIVPNIENRVILLDSCVVNINNARAEYVRIAHGETPDNIGNGRLTILPTGALTIASTLQKFEANGGKFGEGQKITAGDIRILSNESGVGALAFIENTAAKLPEAEVSYYFRAYYDKGSASNPTWQYVGVPFSDAASYHYFFLGGYIEKWDEATGGWIQIKNGSDESLTRPEAFKGYAFTQPGDPSGYYNRSIGTLNPTQNKVWNLEYTFDDANPYYGRNLLANSWTSPIYVNAQDDGSEKAFIFKQGSTETDLAIEKTFYVFNTGTYAQWQNNEFKPVNSEKSSANPAAGQYIAIPIYASNYVGVNTIAPMQGFFVYTKKKNTSLEINYRLAVQNLEETDKSTHPRYAPSRNRKDENIHVTTFTLIGETGVDKAYVLTGNDDFTLGFDNGWDGRKFASGNDVPYLSLVTSGGRMQISAQPELLGSMLSFRAGNDDYYELVITTTETDLMLKDMQTQMLVPLRDTTVYSFYADNKYMTSRFCIVKKPEIATTIGTESGSMLNAFLCDGEIVVTNMTGETVSGGLYDATGKLIQTFTVTTELTTIAKPSAQGVYLIRLNDRTFKITL